MVPLPSTAFPFSRTMHSLPLVFAAIEGQRKQEIGAKWGRKLPKSDHKLVSKGGKRSKEGRLGGTPLVGQVRQRIPLPATACAARCFGLFGISARAVVATTWQEPTIRYLQTTICPKSIRSSACPLIAPSSPLSTPISDHFLNPLNYLRDDKVSSFPVFPSRTSSPLCALSGGPI